MPDETGLTEAARGPGRPRTVRDEEIPARRRSAVQMAANNTLAVDESKLDRAKWEYRWIVDENGRLHNLLNNDEYYLLSADLGGATNQEGDAYRRQVGVQTDGSGKPRYQYLCRKPKVYAEEDRAARQKANDQKQVARVKADEAAVLADNGKKIEDSAMKDAQNAAHQASMKPSDGFR